LWRREPQRPCDPGVFKLAQRLVMLGNG
jgi:hypothetical protein